MPKTNTTRLVETARRLIAVLLLAIALVVAGSGAAGAFVPPGAGAQGNFSCGPAGHPGSTGQFVAMSASGKMAAWNAHVNSDQITNC